MTGCGCRKGAIKLGCLRHDPQACLRRPRLERTAFKVATWLGRLTRWLAVGYREGTPLERVLIWPSWAVCRALSTVAFVTAVRLTR